VYQNFKETLLKLEEVLEIKSFLSTNNESLSMIDTHFHD